MHLEDIDKFRMPIRAFIRIDTCQHIELILVIVIESASIFLEIPMLGYWVSCEAWWALSSMYWNRLCQMRMEV